MQALKSIGLGCLGAGALLLLIVAGLAGIARLQVRSEPLEPRFLSHEVPTAAPGHVILDLAQAEFRIQPGEAGDPVRVEATYDADHYRLDERFETALDRGWTYRVSFRRPGSWIMHAMRQAWGGSEPSIRIFLPPGAPMKLDLRVEQGAATAELGGLWLTEADIAFDKGALDVWVSEPLEVPIDRMLIRGSMGGLSVSSLGNASPRELTVDLGMGGMELGLGGLWVRDADISIRTHMGGGTVRLPRNVRVRGLETASLRPSPETELRPPTLSFQVSTAMGDIHVVDEAR